MSAPPLQQHLQALHLLGEHAMQESVAKHSQKLGRLLQLDLDIKAWEDRLVGRPETPQLSSARRELGMAIYAASTGSYVHAFAGTRLFLELAFASVYFSANELHRRMWVSDRRDFSWSKALDVEDGVLSASFVQEFNPTASPDCATYSTRASSAYRYCSQFLHGKLAVMRELPERIEYDQNVMETWLEHSTSAAMAVLYLLYARYAADVDLSASPEVATVIESHFAHLAHARDVLGLATGVQA